MPTKSQRKLFSAEKTLLKKRGVDEVIHHKPDPGVDTSQILAAIEGLKKSVEKAAAPVTAADLPEMGVLRGQLHEMRESIDKTKLEIASMRKPGEGDDRLVTAAMELDAIVKATEEATNNILSAAEDIDERVQKLKDRIGDVGAIQILDEISGLTIQVFENCNFQDITGQRTNKVVKTINYLEDRIHTMINIWGEEEFEGLVLPEAEADQDKKLLQGPQLEGAGVSQSDIDALFD